MAGYRHRFDSSDFDASEWNSEEDKNAFLFDVREKLAYDYTTDQSMGGVWRLFAYTKKAFEDEYGKVDPSEIIGAANYIIGTDKNHVYLLVLPTDVQYIENNKKSREQYERLQKESQIVLVKFMKDNQITINQKCPENACYPRYSSGSKK